MLFLVLDHVLVIRIGPSPPREENGCLPARAWRDREVEPVAGGVIEQRSGGSLTRLEPRRLLCIPMQCHRLLAVREGDRRLYPAVVGQLSDLLAPQGHKFTGVAEESDPGRPDWGHNVIRAAAYGVGETIATSEERALAGEVVVHIIWRTSYPQLCGCKRDSLGGLCSECVGEYVRGTQGAVLRERAGTIGGIVPPASPRYVWSSGTMGESGLTIAPSGRTDCIKADLVSWPIGSPTPTMPADNVASSRLSISKLMNTSTHGHSPSALARRES